MLPDLNVLVNAFRSDSTDHALCRRWLNAVVNGDSRYGISLIDTEKTGDSAKLCCRPISTRDALRVAAVYRRMTERRLVFILPLN